MASLNGSQGLFGVPCASLHSLDFWAPKKVRRFLFLAEFCFCHGILLVQFLRKMVVPSL
jgi:hypothetical protein